MAADTRSHPLGTAIPTGCIQCRYFSCAVAQCRGMTRTWPNHPCGVAQEESSALWRQTRIIHDRSLVLTPGARVGPYEILSALRAGRMGEVCRARNTKLNRDVAIKVLPDPFATDTEWVARFTREAQTLAS